MREQCKFINSKLSQFVKHLMTVLSAILFTYYTVHVLDLPVDFYLWSRPEFTTRIFTRSDQDSLLVSSTPIKKTTAKRLFGPMEKGMSLDHADINSERFPQVKEMVSTSQAQTAAL
ncbi:uncharacterized protein [Asterias amurensis]